MMSQKLYPVSFLEYLAIVHGCSYQIYTGHFNRYSSIEKNKADTISCGPPLTSKITCFLPYVSNGLIRLFLLGILPMDMEVDILHNNNMLQDLLQICKFIRDIIMCV